MSPVISRSEFMAGTRAEPESTASPSARDSAARTSRESVVSIVPGGGDGFSLPSATTAMPSRPLAASFGIIPLRGHPGEAYEVAHPDSTSPQRLYKQDPETALPVSTGSYVQKNPQGEWVPARPAA
ncbi:MAG TPA: hypothetical protein VME63_11885, partial [Dyella sp.]|uniref:hypothetical protein n=1 Tax=Dyella sp. TaxID=1869338 RepID=UPI002CD096C7